MIYLYLDESGDLGFDFVNHYPSRYFTITVLAVRSVKTNQRLLKAVRQCLHRKIRYTRDPIPELKGSKCPGKIKQYFYSLVAELEFEIYAVTLNKLGVFSKLVENKRAIYHEIACQVLDRIPFRDEPGPIEFLIDKSRTGKAATELTAALVERLTQLGPGLSRNIAHRDSQRNYGLQAVDLFCWGIFRKYERGDGSWYRIFESKIGYEGLYGQ